MKALSPTLLVAMTLLITACNSSITVADPETISEYPEQKPVMLAWQGLAQAAADKDCETLVTYFRITLNVEGELCPEIYAYFDGGAPSVDWSRTDWSASNGKAKIYELDGASITSFIHNEADDSWKSDEKFWE